MKRIISILFLAALAVGTYIILGRSQFREAEGRIFGTTYHIKYASTHDLSNDIEAVLHQVDASLSMFNDSSTLSRFNRGEEIGEDPLFEEVVMLGLKVSEETEGAFDMTVAPLVNAWGFGFKNKDNVTPKQVDSLRSFVGYKLLKVEKKNKRLFLGRADERVTLDCGAIAKGYGVQSVAKMLSEKGCTNYMVEIGGEVVVKGENPEGKHWTLGINKPVDDSTHINNELQEIIRLTDCGIATSGNYRNFYYKGGKKYAHTINPATGYPVEHSLLSATVIHKSCTLADAYATSFMVMGLDAAKDFISKHQDIEAYLIYSAADGKLQTWQSNGFSKFIEKR